MGVKQSYIVACRVRVNEWLSWEWSILREEESLRLSPFLYNLAKPSVPRDARSRGWAPEYHIPNLILSLNVKVQREESNVQKVRKGNALATGGGDSNKTSTDRLR